jgi:uncharacterized membrane protein YjfL (UPF0719 family)
MKAVEWSVLTAMSAGLVFVVFTMVTPALSDLAAQIGNRDCAGGVWTPDALRCAVERASR